MDAVRRIFRILFRLAVVWVVDTLSLLLTAAVLPGIAISSADGTPRLVIAAAATSAAPRMYICS